MSDLLGVGAEWLTSKSWAFTEHERKSGAYIRARYQGNNADYNIVFDEITEIDTFFVYVYLPNKVPEARHQAVSELVNRINHGLSVGNLEFDFRDGGMRFKASVDVERATLTQAMVGNMVSAGVSLCDKYFPVIMRVAYGDKAPVEALEELYEEGVSGGDDSSVNQSRMH